MMAFAMGSLPTSLCLSHKPLYLGLCYSPLLKGPTFHGYVGAAPLCPAVQCTAHEESDTLVQEENRHKEVERSPSWSDPDTPTTPAPVAQPPPWPDQYAGWPPVDSDPKGSWKAGALFSRESFKCVLFSAFSIHCSWDGFPSSILFLFQLCLTTTRLKNMGCYHDGLIVPEVIMPTIERFRLS
jgi:hypothetical protein